MAWKFKAPRLREMYEQHNVWQSVWKLVSKLFPVWVCVFVLSFNVLFFHVRHLVEAVAVMNIASSMS